MAIEAAAGQHAPTAVLDASALMALLHEEAGADAVAAAISAGAVISLVNLAEVLSKLADAGEDPDRARSRLRDADPQSSARALSVESLTEDDCVEVARLRPVTRGLGLSLADRACLALATRLALPVLTADRSWADADVEVEIRQIR